MTKKGTKTLLARETWDSKNVISISAFLEDKQGILLDTAFIKFSEKVRNGQFISMNVRLFDLRVLIGIINQVLTVIRNTHTDNLELKEDEKDKKKPLEYLSKDTLITNRGSSKQDQKTLSVGFSNNTLYLNCLHQNSKLSVGFRKIELDALIGSLTYFIEKSTNAYYKELARLDVITQAEIERERLRIEQEHRELAENNNASKA